MNDIEGKNGPARFDRGEQDFGRFVSNLLANVSTSRKEWLTRHGDARRSLEDECGYKTGEWDATDYYRQYSDNPIAARVVEMLPDACWQVNPEVYEVEDADESTAFEEAFAEVSKVVSGTKSRYLSPVGNPMWEILKRLDRLSGIGRYGVMLIGLDDNMPLDSPARMRSDVLDPDAASSLSKTVARKVTYLRVFPEHLAAIKDIEKNPNSARYGQPTYYDLTLQDPNDNQTAGNSVGQTVRVHWTRCIHVADNLESNEVYGVPRQKAVRHRLEDLDKLYGGSAEMYWRGAFPGLSFQSHPALGADVKMDRESLKDTAEEYMNGLQRYLMTIGIDVKSLAPQVVAPNEQIDVQIEAICIKIDVPKRKFKGSEQGELASSQDEDRWKEKVRARQNNHCTPRVIVPMTNRLIDLWVLPEVENFRVWWPDIQTQSSLEKARIAVSKTQALVQYLQGEVQYLMTVKDYLVNVMGFTEAEALNFFENVQKRPESELIELPLPEPTQPVGSQNAADPTTSRTKGQGRENQSAAAEGQR